MRLSGFMRGISSVCLLLIISMSGRGCGPFYGSIPTIEYFYKEVPSQTISELERAENLALWQSQTSTFIPLKDIEEAVYRCTYADLSDRIYNYDSEKDDNLMFRYIHNSHDEEVSDFLFFAKDLEEKWEALRSPWYYPSSYEEVGGVPEDFDHIISECRNYKGTRFKERYALQGVRALFATRQYGKCVEFFDSVFADVNDAHLMKRMAQRYVAGCYERLGEKAKAQILYAKSGDVWALPDDSQLDLLLKYNPDTPQFIEYARSRINDTTFVKRIVPIAHKMLRNKRVTHKGDWNFLLAYVSDKYDKNKKQSLQRIKAAMSQSFSSEELQSLAYSYYILMRGANGDLSNLYHDIMWYERQLDVLNPGYEAAVRRLRNVAYKFWIPQLWKRGDYATAILLCSYADNVESKTRFYEASPYIDKGACYDYRLYMPLWRLRQSEDYSGSKDYSCLAFQMMNSMTSDGLATIYDNLLKDNELYNLLRSKARTDKDYFYELIGTLALREQNYARAEKYLRQVSKHYQRTMNIYKGGYLSGDVFAGYQKRRQRGAGQGVRVGWGFIKDFDLTIQEDAKLKFARKMLSYQRQMKGGKTGDEQGLARLMYAIGMKNSFLNCWAYTRYWDGFVLYDFFSPCEFYGDEEDAPDYTFLYETKREFDSKAIEERYEKEIDVARRMLTSDESRARFEYILGNVKSVVVRYGDTKMAEQVKSSCDGWRNWL